MVIGPAPKLLTNLLAPEKPGENPYKVLMETLKQYSLKPSEIVQRFKLHTRVRKDGEKVHNYVAVRTRSPTFFVTCGIWIRLCIVCLQCESTEHDSYKIIHDLVRMLLGSDMCDQIFQTAYIDTCGVIQPIAIVRDCTYCCRSVVCSKQMYGFMFCQNVAFFVDISNYLREF